MKITHALNLLCGHNVVYLCEKVNKCPIAMRVTTCSYMSKYGVTNVEPLQMVQGVNNPVARRKMLQLCFLDCYNLAYNLIVNKVHFIKVEISIIMDLHVLISILKHFIA